MGGGGSVTCIFYHFCFPSYLLKIGEKEQFYPDKNIFLVKIIRHCIISKMFSAFIFFVNHSIWDFFFSLRALL